MENTDSRLATMRFCTRCGGALSQRAIEGRLRPACPACGFVVYLDPKVACATLLVRDGRVLLVRRRNEPGRGKWCLPCGYEEADEAPAAAAQRETYEETGLHVTIDALHGVYHYTDDPRGAGVLIVFRAHGDPDAPIAAGDDASEAAFFAANALPPISHHTHMAAISDWLAHDAASAAGEPRSAML